MRAGIGHAARQPPILDGIGQRGPFHDVILRGPEPEADQEIGRKPDEKSQELFKGRVQKVVAARGARVDHQQAGNDHDRADSSRRIDKVLHKRVQRNLLGKDGFQI